MSYGDEGRGEYGRGGLKQKGVLGERIGGEHKSRAEEKLTDKNYPLLELGVPPSGILVAQLESELEDDSE
ncbi:MAG: hypothetical protein M1840_008511 [Geoglossum simile]|nr:MAG: hypothetical protein M1840_008511 [Geoglossum simile]